MDKDLKVNLPEKECITSELCCSMLQWSLKVQRQLLLMAAQT